MTLLDSAIANLEKLMDCYSKQCDQVNFHKTWIELLAYQDVRDGVPRWQREMALHHADWRSLYAEHRVDADLLAGAVGGDTMKALTRYDIEETLMEEREEGEYVTFHDHQAEVDAVIAEAVWAMKMVREAQETWSDPVAKAHVQRCDAFLASQVVTDWRGRQKKEPA